MKTRSRTRTWTAALTPWPPPSADTSLPGTTGTLREGVRSAGALVLSLCGTGQDSRLTFGNVSVSGPAEDTAA